MNILAFIYMIEILNLINGCSKFFILSICFFSFSLDTGNRVVGRTCKPAA